jgi:uncharacterized protein (DUF302 family)
MNVQSTSAYGFGTTVSLPFEQAVERVKEAFKAEGFGTLTEINVQKTLREKIGAEIEPYVILGTCNPNLASRAIALEHEIGLLLPCNVLVHQCGGHVRVSAQDPLLLVEMVHNEALRPIGEEARERIERALRSLGG